jgi:cytochrome c oxidase subunit I
MGGVDTGWTFYPPYSTVYSSSNIAITVIGVLIAGFGTIATGVNFVSTTHTLRAPGLTWFRLPLFVWSIYATSLVMILATPVLAMTLVLVVADRRFGLPVFDAFRGGDPLLFQHLFWFYSHPAVYIMILPAFGVISEVIACFARRRVFGYAAMVYSMLAIAIIGFAVWGHHMFVSGQSVFANLVFSFLSFMVAVPSAIKVFNWTATLYGGQITFEAPMLYALGFVGLFTVGGLTGLALASIPIDVQVTGTYFVIAHFHYVMVGGAVSAYSAGLHFWWPKTPGRLYPESWARFAAFLMFFGFNFTFFPQFILGYLGMPRRYHVYPPEFQTWNVMSSTGAVVLAGAYLMPFLHLAWSLAYGQRSPANPWNATGLEWRTTSPPPTHNFASTPVVDEDPYDTTTSGSPRKPRPGRSTRFARGRVWRPRRGGPLHEQQRAQSVLRYRPARPVARAVVRPRAPARGGDFRHVALPDERDAVLRRRFHGLQLLARPERRFLPGGRPPDRDRLWRGQYGRPRHQQPDDDACRPRGRDWLRQKLRETQSEPTNRY